VIAALVILAVVVYAATGHGGELSAENPDHAPLELGPVSATDVALLRPPTSMWGYSVHSTDEALERIAESIRERDVRIVALEQLVTDLSRDPAPQPLSSPPYTGARHRRDGLTEPAGSGDSGDGGDTQRVPERGDSGDGGDAGRVRERGVSGAGAPPEQSHE